MLNGQTASEQKTASRANRSRRGEGVMSKQPDKAAQFRSGWVKLSEYERVKGQRDGLLEALKLAQVALFMAEGHSEAYQAASVAITEGMAS
jgi:hypothetical protein